MTLAAFIRAQASHFTWLHQFFLSPLRDFLVRQRYGAVRAMARTEVCSTFTTIVVTARDQLDLRARILQDQG